jgi:wyosine [tRNA(Phe)-imidazoG37] synthetase (radical SAM superfamily)
MLSSLRNSSDPATDQPRIPGPGVKRREGSVGRIVYPVISRRSGGLSLGVDLFPDAKSCNFDCPYCEVFPPAAFGAFTAAPFSLAELEDELEEFLDYAYERDWAPEPIRDICFSGSGEPTSSSRLKGALELCVRARRDHAELLGRASIVVITNSTGFFDPATSDLLARYVDEEGLVVWAKLDAGSEEHFELMSGTRVGLDRIADGILAFSRRAGIVIQTMLCEVDGRHPTDDDLGDYSRLLARLCGEGARIDEVHLYTFARPTPTHACAPLGDARLRSCAAAVREGTGLRVRAFGVSSEILIPGAEVSELPSPASSKPRGLRQINSEGVD